MFESRVGLCGSVSNVSRQLIPGLWSTSGESSRTKMQSVSGDDVRKRLHEKSRSFELAAKGVWIRLGHRRRLHGGDGGNCPHGQKVVGATPPQEYCYVKFLKQQNWVNFCTDVLSPLYNVGYTAKYAAKITNVSKKVCWLQSENAPKAPADVGLPYSSTLQ